LTSVSSNFRIVDSIVHVLVTRISLVYLLSLSEITSSRAEALEHFPYSKYSAERWPEHFHASEPERRLLLEGTLARRIFDLPSMTTWLQVNNPDLASHNRTFPPPLYYSSLLGFVNVTQWLLDRGADVNAQGGGYYGNALHAASADGHEAVVRLLLDRDANVNAQGGGGYYGNALHVASENGHEAVVRLLLDRGADVNARGGSDGGNALHVASEKGNEAVVRLLLDRGANANAKGGRGYYGNARGKGGYCGNALRAASENGHEAVVCLLLDRGADINARGKGGYYNDPLHTAARCGNEAVVRLLLDRGADVNTRRGRGSYVNSSQNGDEVVDRLLREHMSKR
jgi:ankyrin repeat protein